MVNFTDTTPTLSLALPLIRSVAADVEMMVEAGERIFNAGAVLSDDGFEGGFEGGLEGGLDGGFAGGFAGGFDGGLPSRLP